MHIFYGTFSRARNRKMHENKEWLVQGTGRRSKQKKGFSQTVTEGIEIKSHHYMAIYCISQMQQRVPLQYAMHIKVQ